MITVLRDSEEVYHVSVRAAHETVHRVTITMVSAQRIAGREVVLERLVEESFRFLLKREPNTSIRRSFELGMISRDFPDYEAVMRAHFKAP